MICIYNAISTKSNITINNNNNNNNFYYYYIVIIVTIINNNKLKGNVIMHIKEQNVECHVTRKICSLVCSSPHTQDDNNNLGIELLYTVLFRGQIYECFCWHLHSTDKL